jgi:nucleoside-diphosphate-sugar epimerase
MHEPKRILVTGAGGFIGGRVVEVLHASGAFTVRAGVRRWSSAARIGRLPVDIVLCDITDPTQVADALRDVDFIVHCAVGDRTTTVTGTEVLLEGALQAGIDRVVHISTIDVYGGRTGSIDEATPLTYSGKAYGDSKIDAEKVCQEYYARGLPVVILRPTIVYGPFSDLWTVEFAQRFRMGTWLLPEQDCQGSCNLVYVDDLVAAILRALSTPAGAGEAFNINGTDRVTWNQYFRALNDAMGLPPLASTPRARARLSAAAMTPVRLGGKFVLNRFAGPVTAAYKRFPLVKRLMKFAEGLIRKTPSTGEFHMYARSASFPIGKAERVLGYRPAFTMDHGVALSAAWLRHHGYALPVPDALAGPTALLYPESENNT